MDRRTLRLGTAVGLVIACAGALWSEHRYVGPYRWLVTSQDLLLGRHYPFLTFLCAYVGLAIPLAAFGALVPSPAIDMSRAILHFRTYPRHGQGCVVATLALGVGLAKLAGALSGGPEVILPLADAETRASPPAFVHLLDATLDLNFAVTQSQDAIYVPLRSTRGGIPVVIAKFTREELEAFDAADGIRGLLERDGLPGDVRAHYEGADRLAAPHYLMRVGDTPASARSSAYVLLSVGGALTILVAGYYALVIRRA